MFKVFKNEVENQLRKIIKALRSDRGGEYISQECKDYLKACGIVQQLTPGVSERRNRTLLDMVRSMMNLTTLPLSFWDYALESATRILNMVPTKKVDKTPYELWRGKVPNLSYLKETMGYYFYFPPENKVVVASEIPMEVEGFEPPQEEVISVCRSERTHRAPTRLCLNVEAEEHSLGDLNEPTSYKAAMLDPESNKWLDAMNAKMQSMIDNMVWVLVDLPPNCKTVRSKWIFKKKTNMDGVVHTYKARLVVKGYTQLYGVDYEETFSPVADIRAIRILISIAAFYDYEIWQMDVKTAFLNGYLDEDIYMVQPKGFVDPNHPRKVCKLQRSIYGLKQASRSWNKRLDEEIKYGNRKRTLRVECYCDAGFETDRDDTKSQTGYVFILNGGAVDWKSSKQSTTAMSATEAEYIAASEAAMEAVWITKFISGFGIVPTINEPIKMFCDNSAALHFANEPGVQSGARHYHRRYHYVCESIALGEIKLLKVHTDDNLANPFTKALPNGKLTQHARSMELRLASSFM
ncbi:retrotransposon protein, putative, ty1-copia subclass [Tanacetum coccineum]